VVDQANDHEAVSSEQTRSRAAGPSAVAEARAPAGVLGLASHLGNRGFGRFLGRMSDGTGLLPGGLVHPDVESAISTARGAGHPLHSGTAGRLSETYGDPLGDVRVHAGPQADVLARAVSARAFTVGSDIFFASGEYQPGTSGGEELIAHEVAHVIQQRCAPESGPLTVSQPGDAMERDAEAAARDFAG
jgi:hypothetical protein